MTKHLSAALALLAGAAVAGTLVTGSIVIPAESTDTVLAGVSLCDPGEWVDVRAVRVRNDSVTLSNTTGVFTVTCTDSGANAQVAALTVAARSTGSFVVGSATNLPCREVLLSVAPDADGDTSSPQVWTYGIYVDP